MVDPVHDYTMEKTAKVPEHESGMVKEGETIGYTIRVQNTGNQPLEEILADIYGRKPDAAAFSCYIWNWKLIRELIGELHQVMPDLPIWLGGPEVSFDAEQILEEYPFLAGIMVGEGEATFFGASGIL